MRPLDRNTDRLQWHQAALIIATLSAIAYFGLAMTADMLGDALSSPF